MPGRDEKILKMEEELEKIDFEYVNAWSYMWGHQTDYVRKPTESLPQLLLTRSWAIGSEVHIRIYEKCSSYMEDVFCNSEDVKPVFEKWVQIKDAASTVERYLLSRGEKLND